MVKTCFVWLIISSLSGCLETWLFHRNQEPWQGSTVFSVPSSRLRRNTEKTSGPCFTLTQPLCSDPCELTSWCPLWQSLKEASPTFHSPFGLILFYCPKYRIPEGTFYRAVRDCSNFYPRSVGNKHPSTTVVRLWERVEILMHCPVSFESSQCQHKNLISS